MANGPAAASSTNNFIPNWVDSGRLMAGFSRNKSKFAVANYVDRRKVEKTRGFYKRINYRDARRVDPRGNVWPAGTPRPVPTKTEAFVYVPFELTRRDYPYGTDDLTAEVSDHDLKQQERRSKAQKMMTSRTKRVADVVTTASNWQASAWPGYMSANHTDTAASFVGASLAAGTSSSPAIAKFITNAMELMTRDTGAAIEPNPDQLHMIFNPNTARKLALSQEITDYYKNNPVAYDILTGRKHSNADFFLPPTFGGVSFLIERTVLETGNRKAADSDTPTTGYAWPDDVILLTYREPAGPPDKDNGVDAPAASAVTMFYKEDMTSEEFENRRDRMWEGHLTEHTVELVTNPCLGYLLTAAFTAP